MAHNKNVIAWEQKLFAEKTSALQSVPPHFFHSILRLQFPHTKI